MLTNQNHQVAEVLCAIWFNTEVNKWDSTYFGRYFEKLEQMGFTEKNEQKSVHFKMEINNNENIIDTPQTEMKEGEPRMVFRNVTQNTAVILSSNFISFHKLPPYDNWENLINNLVEPGLKAYQSLGLGKEVIQVQCLYLNKFELDTEDHLSKYFNFIPSIQNFGIGIERNTSFQSHYELAPNLQMLIKLNSSINSTNHLKEVFLECSCFASALENHTIFELARQAHDQTSLVFNSLIN
jgi:uncharacterized protein (TIGR04255 family)